MICRKVLIRPCKSPGNPEMYSERKSYGMKHKKPQTGNLSVAVARGEEAVSAKRERNKKQTYEKS